MKIIVIKLMINRRIYERKGDYIPAENIESMIKDLLYEIDRLNEKIEDMENDIRDNYRPISNEEMYG